MGRRKDHDMKMGSIQSEQLKLEKMKCELEALLGKVNESINELKVEELQLKSNAVTAMNFKSVDSKVDPRVPPLSDLNDPLHSFADMTTTGNQHNLHQMEAEVNKQVINLDMFVLPTKAHIEEEDESD